MPFFGYNINKEDNNMEKVLVAAGFYDNQKKQLEQKFPQLQFVYQDDVNADIIIGNYSVKKLKDFKNLKWIQLTAVGYDNYIKQGIFDHDVVITNSVDVHSVEVAEHIVGLLMTLLKKIYIYRDNQHQHIWHDEGKVKSINGLRVCIVGFGDIGKALAKILKGMGMYTIGVKRKPIEKPQYLDELYLQQDLDKAISDVDVVVSVLPGTSENVHLFDRETFEKMKPDTIFINAGRGNLVDSEVLYQVLADRVIACAGQDVFEQEPLPADSPLWTLDNLIVTPHVAGFFHLDSALDRYLDLVIDNLQRYLDGEELLNVVKERE